MKPYWLNEKCPDERKEELLARRDEILKGMREHPDRRSRPYLMVTLKKLAREISELEEI